MKRRDFIKLSSTATVASYLGALNVPQELNAQTIKTEDDYKAIVCIMLSGGNDSYNMLVPTNTSSYNAYKDSRSNLALNKRSLNTLDFKDENEQTFGLHPIMQRTQNMFNNQELSFVANIGPLVEPTTKASYFNSSTTLPLGLMSHADQLRHWLTSIPNKRVNYGIGGRIADTVQKHNTNQSIPMNISLSGSNYFQNGKTSKEYAITKQGSVGLNINEKNNILDEVLYKSFNNLLRRNYENDFKQTYMEILRSAQNNHDDFKHATQSTAIKTVFSPTDLSQELKMVAKSIKGAKKLGMKRQIFYVLYHGWDHHDELLNEHESMLEVLDNALYEFSSALKEIHAFDKVTTFTASDFGRSLTSNGNGTDHAWGGNNIVLGGSVKGQRIFGQYPDLTLDNPLDIGGGVFIPTTSTDVFYKELLQWYGLTQSSIKEILPNISHFKQSLNMMEN